MPQIHKLVYAIKNSTTQALPRWFHILEELSLEPRMMPCDVCTRWNTTCDMLQFAYEYKDAINKITDTREMKLRDYEIKLHEWDIVKQLQDILAIHPLTSKFT
jgi:hypothetical protein